MLRWLRRSPRTIELPRGKRITQIPICGNSGATPTGALQFRDDWPGLFIRGDQAGQISRAVAELRERLAGHPDRIVASSLVTLQGFADMIARDVFVDRSDDIPDW